MFLWLSREGRGVIIISYCNKQQHRFQGGGEQQEKAEAVVGYDKQKA